MVILRLDQGLVERERLIQARVQVKKVHSIFRFFRTPSPLATPVVRRVCPGIEYELTTAAVEAGVAALRASPHTIVVRVYWFERPVVQAFFLFTVCVWVFVLWSGSSR